MPQPTIFQTGDSGAWEQRTPMEPPGVENYVTERFPKPATEVDYHMIDNRRKEAFGLYKRAKERGDEAAAKRYLELHEALVELQSQAIGEPGVTSDTRTIPKSDIPNYSAAVAPMQAQYDQPTEFTPEPPPQPPGSTGPLDAVMPAEAPYDPGGIPQWYGNPMPPPIRPPRPSHAPPPGIVPRFQGWPMPRPSAIRQATGR